MEESTLPVPLDDTRPRRKGPLRGLLHQMWKNLAAREQKKQRFPLRQQESTFARLREGLRGTEIDREYSVSSCTSYKEFVERVPPRTFSDYQSKIERVANGENGILFRDRCESLVLTSGTTGYLDKKIPYNSAMIAASRRFQYKCASVIGSVCDTADPALDKRMTYATMVRDPRLMMSPKGHVPIMYMSQIMAAGKQPRLARSREVLRPGILNAPTWEEKLRGIASVALHEDVRLVSGIPLYLLQIFEHLKREAKVETLREIWPHFEAFIYSGSSVEKFKPRIRQLLGVEPRYFSVYIASEGCFGLPTGNSEKMLFNLDDVVFGFLPPDANGQFPDQATGPALGLHQLQAGREYEILVSGPNGLLQFRVGDVIRIETLEPFITFSVLGRTTMGINLANEKVSQPTLEEAFRRAQTKRGPAVAHFFVYPGNRKIPGMPADSDTEGRPYYQWDLVLAPESSSGAVDTDAEGLRQLEQAWAHDLEQALISASPDYRDCRVTDKLIGGMQVRFLPHRVAEELFAERQGSGQFKMKSVFRTFADHQSYLSKALEAAGVSERL